jgi:inorganic pyrophosphatase/exopolyphosphatase
MAAPVRLGASWLRGVRAAVGPFAPRPFPSRLHLVLGNEACDADSVVSAVTWAYYLAGKERLRLAAAAGAASSATLVVPVVNCRREDWPLRREAQHLLRRGLWADDEAAADGDAGEVDVSCGASSSSSSSSSPAVVESPPPLLLFADDLPRLLPDLLAAVKRDPASVRITLVDHNELTGVLADAGLGACVTEIVDHHMDAGKHLETTCDGPGTKEDKGGDDDVDANTDATPPRRWIAFDPVERKGVGSTCTLVAHRLLRASKAGAAPAAVVLDARLAELLLSVIVIDTVGLDPSAGRTTPLDDEVVASLQSVIAQERGGAPLDTAATFRLLMGLKAEEAFWSALPVGQALGFDFKAFAATRAAEGGRTVVRFGTSSVMVPALTFLRGWEGTGQGGTATTEGRLAAVAAFAESRALDFEVVLSMVAEPSVQRQLAFVAPRAQAGLVDRLVAALEATGQLGHLRDVGERLEGGGGGGAGPYVRVFEQGNHKASRKQVVPLLLEALEGGKE